MKLITKLSGLLKAITYTIRVSKRYLFLNNLLSLAKKPPNIDSRVINTVSILSVKVTVDPLQIILLLAEKSCTGCPNPFPEINKARPAKRKTFTMRLKSLILLILKL
jgi:hypothetical protein